MFNVNNIGVIWLFVCYTLTLYKPMRNNFYVINTLLILISV